MAKKKSNKPRPPSGDPGAQALADSMIQSEMRIGQAPYNRAEQEYLDVQPDLAGRNRARGVISKVRGKKNMSGRLKWK